MARPSKLYAFTALSSTLAMVVPFAMHMNTSQPDLAQNQTAPEPEAVSTTEDKIVQPEPISLQAVTESLRPQLRPDDLMEQHRLANIRPKERPFTLNASILMKEVYEPEASAALQERMTATLGKESHAAVLNWDNIDLSEYAQDELQRFLYELETLQQHPENRDSFSQIAEYAEKGMFEGQSASHAELVAKIKSDYAFSHLSPNNQNAAHIAVSNYGELDKEAGLGKFFTVSMPRSEAELEAENAMLDDYVKRHENCHGIDPDIYGWASDRHATSETFIAGATSQGQTLSMKNNYRHYMVEQFADTCAALEYIIEDNQEGIELMERVSYYRDSATLNGLSQRMASGNLPRRAESGTPEAELKSMVLSRIQGRSHEKSYFMHHDTGPSIRTMLQVGSRLTHDQKEEFRENPNAFLDFVKETIEESSLTPEQYMALPDDLVKLVQNRGTEISPEMRDIIDRGYDGEKAILEHNLQIPRGSIDNLREVAPISTKSQMREYIKIQLTEQEQDPFKDKGSLPYGIEHLSQDLVRSMDVEDRIAYANTHAIMRSTDEWGSLNVIDPNVVQAAKEVHLDFVPMHKESFHSRNYGQIYSEAGHELQKIAEPEATLEHDGVEIKF